ncbi:hypothetical protein [Pseudomonas sp. Irchel s3h14]|uniref:hypothetical protein n=1 Tax=Pseudomonas sp. Irchel s3h14 TaxID=2009179 RepID=UPI000BA3506A|nr:hypothetical protein [Pseudomonas sp. Irchel s3h14]
MILKNCASDCTEAEFIDPIQKIRATNKGGSDVGLGELLAQTAGYWVDFPFENYEHKVDFMRECKADWAFLVRRLMIDK